MTWGIILVVGIAVWAWIALTDHAVAFAPAAATGMLTRRQLLAYGLSAIIAGGVFLSGSTTQTLAEHLLFTSYYSVVIVAVSAFVALYATRRIGRYNSMIYAFLGAAAAWILITRDGAGLREVSGWPVTWIVAPMAAGVLAALLLRAYISFTAKTQTHLLTRSHRLHLAMIAAILLLGIAVGINNGALILALFSGIDNNISVLMNRLYLNESLLSWVVILLATAFLLRRVIARKITLLSVQDYDLNAPALLATTLSTGIVMLLFSFDSLIAWTGLTTSPLAAGHLILASVAGTSVVQHRQGVDFQTPMKAFISLLATPSLAFGIAYAIFSMSMDRIVSDTRYRPFTIASPQMHNLAIPLLVILFAATLVAIIVIMRKHQQVKLQARNHAIEQQQQLFEKQKDLTALEIKQVLIENESLNNRLELRRNELINIALGIGEQKDFLDSLLETLKSARAANDPEHKDQLLSRLEGMILQRTNFSQESESLYAQAEVLHRDFTLRLSEKYPRLTTQERKMATLLRLGFSTKYIATLMNISPKSVDIGRYRLRSKFGLQRDRKLTEFIKSI